MDNGILNVRTDVNACDCTRGCTDTVRESALKVEPGRKIPCRTGGSNLRRQRAGPTLYQLSYNPTLIMNHSRLRIFLFLQTIIRFLCFRYRIAEGGFCTHDMCQVCQCSERENVGFEIQHPPPLLPSPPQKISLYLSVHIVSFSFLLPAQRNPLDTCSAVDAVCSILATQLPSKSFRCPSKTATPHYLDICFGL